MKENVRISEKMPENKKENEPNRIPKVDFSQPSGSFADRVMFLQRTIGNIAVERLILSGTLQAKLRIGPLDDKYEQEADMVADQVMRMSESGIPEKMTSVKESIQRKCPKLEEYEMMHRKPHENGLKAQRSRTPEIIPELETEINSISGRGQPLPKSVRSFFEPRFGYDFSSVQVHTDNRADRLSRSVNALAFTVGNNIVFSSGAYNPASNEGLHLLAHELTHTVQQNNSLKAKQYTPEGKKLVAHEMTPVFQRSSLPKIDAFASVNADIDKISDLTSQRSILVNNTLGVEVNTKLQRQAIPGIATGNCCPAEKKEVISKTDDLEKADSDLRAAKNVSVATGSVGAAGCLIGLLSGGLPGAVTCTAGGAATLYTLYALDNANNKYGIAAKALDRAKKELENCQQSCIPPSTTGDQQQPIDLGNVEDWSENQQQPVDLGNVEDMSGNQP